MNSQTLPNQLLDLMGDWNPQLFRELKGRLKPRNIAIAIGISVVAQVLFLGWFWLQLPKADFPAEVNFSAYCFGAKTSDFYAFYHCNSPIQINWQAWWLSQFRTIGWLLPIAPVVIGSAFLANDIAQESQRGTLNFIRLSPQSSRTILFGKMLGVPSLIYLLILVAMPLHLISAIGAGVSPLFLVSYYLMTGLGCYLLHSVSLLVGLIMGAHSGSQLNKSTNTGIGVGAIALCLFQSYMWLNLLTTWARFNYLTDYNYSSNNYLIEWFHLPISDNTAIANVFGVVTMLVAIQGVWYALDRSFNLPNRPLISKRQSYICVTFFELFLLGFLVRSGDPAHLKMMGLMFLNALNLAVFFVLTVVLTPQRQPLLDWARYRHTNSNGRSLWQDLLWSENSPATVAIGVNGVIVSVILMPWVAFSEAAPIFIYGRAVPSTPELLLVLVSQVPAFLTFAAIYQSLVFWARNQKKQQFAFAMLVIQFFTPLVTLFLYGMSNRQPAISGLWVLAGYPVGATFADNFLDFSVLGAIATQIAVLSYFSLNLKKTLQKAGASEFQQLSESKLERQNSVL